MAASRKLRKHGKSLSRCRPSSRQLQGTALASSQSFDRMHKGISLAARLGKPVSWQLAGKQFAAGEEHLSKFMRGKRSSLCAPPLTPARTGTRIGEGKPLH